MFNILGVNYWKQLEIVLFVPSNTSSGVGKHHIFWNKLLGTLGDAPTYINVIMHIVFLKTSF
jgi:hypothetical protein